MTTVAVNTKSVRKSNVTFIEGLKAGFINYCKEVVEFYGEIYGRAYNCRRF